MAINRRTILSSFAWKLMEKISVQGISFVVSIVLARILCPTDYGLRKQAQDLIPSLSATLAMGLLTYIAGLFDMGNTATLTIRSIVALASYPAICYCFRIESFMYIIDMLHRR